MKGKVLTQITFMLILIMILLISNNLAQLYYTNGKKEALIEMRYVLNNPDKVDISKFYVELLNTNATIIANYNSTSDIGVYDPTGYLYQFSSKIVSMTEYRYFSDYDYLDRRDVKVKVGEEECKPEYIHCFINVVNLPTQAENFQILNLFNYSNDIKNVFLVGDMTDEAKSIFLKNGFKDTGLPYYSLFAILSYNLSSNKNIFGILIVSLMMLMIPFLIYYLLIEFKINAKEIELHNVLGLSYKSIFKKSLKFIFISIISSAVSTIIVVSLIRYNNVLYLHLFNIFEINLLIFIVFNVSYCCLFCFYYLKGGKYYA